LRNFRLKLSLYLGFILKGLGSLANFLIVPVLINFMGPKRYGIWLTIYSLIGWLVMLDFGLGNGLKIKLAEAFSRKKFHQIRSLISTVYITTGLIVVSLLILFLILSSFISFPELFKIKKEDYYDFNFGFTFLFISVLFILLLKLVAEIYAGLLLPFLDEIIRVLSVYVLMLAVFSHKELGLSSSITTMAFLTSIPMLLIYLGWTFYIFIYKAPSLLPSCKYYSKKLLGSVVRPGINFFIIGLCSVVLYSTDNLIISMLISSEAVSAYNISYKLFGIPFLLFSTLISTHWVSFTEALTKNDIFWIKKKVLFFRKIYILLFVLYFLLYYNFETVVKFWIGNGQVWTDQFLNASMVVYYLISSYITITIYVVNASGKIVLQKYLYLVISIFNIPLSIFLVKNLSLGVSGVIISSSLCLLLLAFYIPKQAFKILDGLATGIFNR
jgi:O-antigen/teichoic acid export membrane protein